MAGFPNQVNVQPGVGVAGDFASGNPRSTVLNGPGAFVAGPFGCNVGLFAWADAANIRCGNTGPGAPTGFVGRAQQGLINVYLQEASQQIPAGLPTVLFSSGDFWVKNDGSTSATVNMKAYVNNATGQISFAATASPTVGGTSTASTIAATTSTASSIAVNSFTGTIAGNVLTVSAIATGALFPGQVLSGGSGTNLINPATTVVKQLTGTIGSTGTYQVSVSQTYSSATITGSGATLTVGGTVTGYYAVGAVISGSGITTGSTILAAISGAGIGGTYAVSAAQTVSSQAINATGGLLTVGGTLTGTFALNDLISTGASAGTYITALLTGTGGAGNYLVNNGQTVASTTISVNSNTETKWIAASPGAPGEMVKMSTHLLG